jgi:hypothetical protein
MFNTRTLRPALVAVVALLAVGGSVARAGATPALATEAPPASPSPAARDPQLHLDVEIDPTAYVLDGYSLHVGLGWRRVRVDLGAFALALPGAFVPGDDFAVSFNGYGAKLQFFPFAEQRGGFVGADAALTWQLVERADTDLAARDRQVTLGVNAGWRFALGDRLYVTPWIGVGRVLGARAVTLGGSRYEPMRTVVFPAIHIGYRFQ